MPACLLACLPASWPLFCAGPRRRRRCPSDSVHSCHVSRARLLARYSGQTLWGHTVQAWLKDLLGPHWGAARRWRSFPRTRCPSVLLRVRHVNCTEPPTQYALLLGVTSTSGLLFTRIRTLSIPKQLPLVVFTLYVKSLGGLAVGFASVESSKKKFVHAN